MNDLQLALLVVGIVIILGIIAFNWWQERKFRNETIRRFGSPQGDVLLSDELDQAVQSSMAAELVMDEADVVVTRVKPSEPQPEQQAAIETELRLPAEGLSEDRIDQLVVTAPVAADNHEPPVITATVLEESPDSDHTGPLSEPKRSPVTETQAAEAEEPVISDDIESLPLHIEQPTPVALAADIDLLVDLVASLVLTEPVSGSKLRGFITAVADIDKPKVLHGLDVQGTWHLIDATQDEVLFTRVTCSLQLADRAGFVSQNMLNHFQREVEKLSASLSAGLSWQPEGDAWQRANELDQFCIDVDQMVGFHLLQGGNGPFTGTKFRGLAEANGLVLAADGGFHSLNEEGLRHFSVINRDNNPFSSEMLRTSVIYGITFQLDIPLVSHCLETFNQMVLTARQMEKSLGANLVDDNQRSLGEAQIEKIRQQLKVIQAKMLTRGIVPGSSTALRLFS